MMRDLIDLIETSLAEARRASAAERYIEKATELFNPYEVRVDMHAEDDFDVAIQRFHVEHKGEGVGTATLKALDKLADRMGITLFLEALPDEDDDDMEQDTQRLIAFYRRAGFEGGDHDGMMFRSPKRKKASS